MNELLDKWCDLEPKRCTMIAGQYRVMRNGSFKTASLPGQEVRANHLDLIQVAVQEAIEAQGGDWELAVISENTSNDVGEKNYHAEVNRWPERWDKKDNVREWGDGPTAAEALLNAYLTALPRLKYANQLSKLEAQA